MNDIHIIHRSNVHALVGHYMHIYYTKYDPVTHCDIVNKSS